MLRFQIDWIQQVMSETMTKNDYLYSVVIPVYNSEAVVAKTIALVRNFFLSQTLRFEIILVNDGSQDDSWGVISGLARNFPEVVAINLLKTTASTMLIFAAFGRRRENTSLPWMMTCRTPPKKSAN